MATSQQSSQSCCSSLVSTDHKRNERNRSHNRLSFLQFLLFFLLHASDCTLLSVLGQIADFYVWMLTLKSMCANVATTPPRGDKKQTETAVPMTQKIAKSELRSPVEIDFDPLMTARETASYTSSSAGSLAQMRHRGTGPRFIKFSTRKILYRKSDVDAWLADRERTITE